MAIRRWVTALLVVLVVLVSSAVALAQSDAPAPPAGTERGVDEVRFIGDLPGNEQTGEWEGEYGYEG